MQTQHQQNNTFTKRQTSPLWPVTKTTVLGFFSEMISVIFSEPVKFHILEYEKIIQKNKNTDMSRLDILSALPMPKWKRLRSLDLLRWSKHLLDMHRWTMKLLKWEILKLRTSCDVIHHQLQLELRLLRKRHPRRKNSCDARSYLIQSASLFFEILKHTQTLMQECGQK